MKIKFLAFCLLLLVPNLVFSEGTLHMTDGTHRLSYGVFGIGGNATATMGLPSTGISENTAGTPSKLISPALYAPSQPPFADHTQVTNTNSLATRGISCTLTDDNAVVGVSMWYSIDGAIYTDVAMSLSSGNLSSGDWVGLIPAIFDDEVEVCYYFTATDGEYPIRLPENDSDFFCYHVDNTPPDYQDGRILTANNEPATGVTVLRGSSISFQVWLTDYVGVETVTAEISKVDLMVDPPVYTFQESVPLHHAVGDTFISLPWNVGNIPFVAYYVDIAYSDSVANSSADPLETGRSFTFVVSPFSNPIPTLNSNALLIVDSSQPLEDYSGSRGAGKISNFVDVYSRAGDTVEIWDVFWAGKIKREVLAQYIGDRKNIIWWKPEEFNPDAGLTVATVQEDLTNYLDNGGELMVTGENIASTLTNNGTTPNPLINDYLQVQYTGTTTETTLEGQNLAEGVTLELEPGESDVINLNSGSGTVTPIFSYNSNGNLQLAAVANETDTYRTTFYGFDFDKLDELQEQEDAIAVGQSYLLEEAFYPVDDLSISQLSDEAVLNWNSTIGALQYNIYEGVEPDSNQVTTLVNSTPIEDADEIMEWVDATAVGDADDRFFGVTAIGLNGDESPHISNYVGVVNDPISAGVNTIAYSVVDTSLTVATQLAETITGATSISVWNPVEQDITQTSTLVDGNWLGDTIPLREGETYLVHTDSINVASVIGQVPLNVNFNLSAAQTSDQTSQNIISVPWDSDLQTASQLGDSIQGATMITAWNPVTQEFQVACTKTEEGTWLNNFPIRKGRSYFVNVTQNSQWPNLP